MVREDLIEGAVTFLQDPSVATAPVEQKIAFLRSKNLTQEEIDVSLSRIGQPNQAPPPQSYSPQQQQYRQPPQQYYNNNGYPNQQYPPWAQPPPEVPKRDWRDWFIMATVLGGVGYATYWTAKRYIYPLIAPPTPPQLEQDKQHIDESFDKAFALLDQLAADTSELKASEQARKERLDSALAEVESVIGRMKEANEEREREAKGVARELNEVREAIPKAIEREKRSMDEKLDGLTQEMKSLRTLVANRMQAPAPQVPQPSQQPQQQQRPAPYTAQSQPQNGVNGTSSSHSGQPAQTNGSSTADGASDGQEKPSAPSVLPERSASGSPYSRLLGGGNKAQIPQWQLEAKKRSEAAAAARKEAGVGASEAGTPPVQVEEVAEGS